MNIIKSYITSLLFFLIIQACVPLIEPDYDSLSGNIMNPNVQRILDLQNAQEADSLLARLSSAYATDRYWSTRAMASFQTEEAIDTLIKLLRDPIEAIPSMAAYALGQIGSAVAEDSLIAAFNVQDPNSLLNKRVLEALGKCGSLPTLRFISSTENYKPTDTLLLEGQLGAIYRFMLRNIVTNEGTDRAIQVLQDVAYPNSVRLLAANYLFRGSNLELENRQADQPLAVALQKETDPNIRMAVAVGLAKTKTPLALEALLRAYSTEQDYRVKCNMLRAFRYFDYYGVRDTVYAALRHPNLHVAKTAVDYLINHGAAREANIYRRISRDTSLHPVVQIGLLEASNKNLPSYFLEDKGRTVYTLEQQFNRQTDPYLKAAAMRAMGHYPRMYQYLIEQGLTSELLPVRTAAMEGLKMICENPDFDAIFRSRAVSTSRVIGSAILQNLKSKDDGLVALGAAALIVPDRGFNQIMADSVGVLENILSQLSLPQSGEAYNELLKTIDYFKGTETPPYVHQEAKIINWEIIQSIGEGTRVTISTTKGSIQLRLMPNMAPATVSSFVELLQEGYYDGKNFHRVVSNFVAQGGCPRGDGYGSLDFTIRSELPPISYNRAGMVGMASAGLHTEGVQFFITHSPTLHLDGRYTIFAEVTYGMEVVNEIQVGDVIESISINGLVETEAVKS